VNAKHAAAPKARWISPHHDNRAAGRAEHSLPDLQLLQIAESGLPAQLFPGRGYYSDWEKIADARSVPSSFPHSGLTLTIGSGRCAAKSLPCCATAEPDVDSSQVVPDQHP
jgi:hypothetical protein